MRSNFLKKWLWLSLAVGLVALPLCASGCAGETRGFGLVVDIPIIGGRVNLGITEMKVDQHSADAEAPYFPKMIDGKPAEEVLDEAEAEAIKLLEAVKAKRAALEAPPGD